MFLLHRILPSIYAATEKKDASITNNSLIGYEDSYYSRTIQEPHTPRAPLRNGQSVEADVCVIGGGFAGLATALGCAEKGKKVVLLEKRRVGFMASGRNGGFALNGFAVELEDLWEMVGAEKAKVMFDLSVEGQKLLRKRIDKFRIQCDVEDSGSMIASCFIDREKDYQDAVKDLNAEFGTNLKFLNKDQVRRLYNTDSYHCAVYDPSGFTVHPLNLSLGLARAAEKMGVQIFEGTSAVTIDDTPQMGASRRFLVHTKHTGYEGGDSGDGSAGSVKADHVVLAGSASLDASLDWSVARAVIPVYTYIMVTEPIPERLKEAVNAPYSICDDLFALHYFRPLKDGRLLWGGFCTAFPISQEKLKSTLVKDMATIFPQLADVKADVVWGGAMGCGLSFMPMIGKKREGLWYCTGFAGHGVVPTTMAGNLIASAIVSNGKDQRYQIFEKEFPLQYAGWPFGHIGAEVTYFYYQAKDALMLWKQKIFQKEQ